MQKRPKLSDRELELHGEANRIAHDLFVKFYTELKKTKLKELTAQEALALVTDCSCNFASQAVGTVYESVKSNLSEFITEDMIIETVYRAFKTDFKCFIKLQNIKPQGEILC